ncbi:MAG: ubiquinone/menaquinone biosynthesis methyltransferase [Chloroflexota bacterium]
MAGTSYKTAQSRFLHRVFTDIPQHYDLINKIMTWGLDKQWRRLAVKECLASNPERILDLGCGTGDFTIELVEQTDKSSEIIGVDFNQYMLEVAKEKSKKLGNSNKLSFVSSDAADLLFPDGYFNSIGISFAFRNLSYNNPMMGQYITEVLRVLKAGGRFVILETSRPKSWFMKKAYNIYMRYFIYWLGFLLSGSREAYRYLAESVVNYYSPDELKQILLKAGFRQVYFRRLFFGVVSIHTAIK